MQKIPELKEQVLNQATSSNLGQYIWKCGIGPQLGYSFSIIHALAYSFIGYQTAYLATKWNSIYWDTACLVVNSGSLEEDSDIEFDDDEKPVKKEKGSDYSKIAKAIGEITSRGIEVSLVNINTSDYGFEPDVKNNRILYGLKALSNINAEMIEQIKANRPYKGIKDFMMRLPLKKTAMISLIKAGAFDEVETVLDNRKQIMTYYILKISEPKKRLTLQNWAGLVSHDLIPKELELQIRIYNFTKFLKANCKRGEWYALNESCISFFEKFLPEELEKVQSINSVFCITQKEWDKDYKKLMDPARDWLKENQEETLKKYNQMLFKEVWDKYAEGTESHWEMESLCFYHGDHELKDVDMNKYGLSNFKDLTSCEVESYWRRGGRQIPIYKLSRIAGTVLSKNDNRHSISLLTTSGVVPVKMTMEQYSKFKKQISQIQLDGKKKIIEKGWFKRGTKLLFTGYRREDQFVVKTYSSTPTHSIYKILSINGDEFQMRHERVQGDGTLEEDYEE